MANTTALILRCSIAERSSLEGRTVANPERRYDDEPELATRHASAAAARHRRRAASAARDEHRLAYLFVHPAVALVVRLYILFQRRIVTDIAVGAVEG